jgi:hypothetical protein
MKTRKPKAIPSLSPQTINISTPPLAMNVQDAARACGVPTWTVRENILLGNLRAKHAGRSHIVLMEDLKRWLESLTDVGPSRAKSILARQEKRTATEKFVDARTVQSA